MSNDETIDSYRKCLKLIASGRGDTNKAFSMLHDRYNKAVLGSITRIVPVERYGKLIPEEISQEVWIRVLRFAHKFDPKSNPEYWLRKIASNLAKNHVTSSKNRRLESLDEYHYNLHDSPPSPEYHADNEECLNRALEELEKHSPDCMRIVLLSTLDGMSSVELGEELGIKPRSATQKLFECRKKLRNLIDRQSETRPFNTAHISATPSRGGSVHSAKLEGKNDG